MPYTAYNPDEKEIHFPAQADPESTYLCTDCKKPAVFVQSHTRSYDGSGESSVDAHFRYSNCTHGTVAEISDNTGGGDGGGGGAGGGESLKHKRRKRAALQEALNRFSAADFDTERFIGDKKADAVLVFEQSHEEYGRGLAIEYQHENEDKDIEATETNYAKNEYTTLWLWDSEFTFNSSIPDIDLFGGRVYTPWPDAVPKTEEWRGQGLAQEKQSEWSQAYDRGLTDSVVEADVLKHWVVPTQKEYWEMTEWGERFPDENELSARDYRLQTAIPKNTTSLSVPATIPRHWVLPTTSEYWRSHKWEDRFRDESQTSTADYRAQAAVPYIQPSRNTRVTFSPNTIDNMLYEYRNWDQLFEPYKSAIFQTEVFLNGRTLHESEKIEIEIDPAILIDQSDMRKSIPQPSTAFDDVQCHSCGHYQYAPNADDCCPTCGTAYDWTWNVESGRISEDSVPNGIKT